MLFPASNFASTSNLSFLPAPRTEHLCESYHPWLEPSESDSEYELESDDERGDDSMDGDFGVFEYEEHFD